MNLKLESVDAVYRLEFDDLMVVENYVPTDEESFVILVTDRADVAWAKRKTRMLAIDFEAPKKIWDEAGVVVRNGAGAVIPTGNSWK